MDEPWSASASDEVDPPPSVGQPVGFLAGGAAACVMSVLVLLVGEPFMNAVTRHVLAWFLASIVGFTFVVMYRRETERLRHEEPSYVANPTLDLAGTALLILGIVLAGINAWLLATDLAS